MKKIAFLFVTSFVIFACGPEEPVEEVNIETSEEEVAEEELSAESTSNVAAPEIVVEEVVDVKNENWQINDYVEFILDTKVAEGFEDAEEPYFHHYTDLDIGAGYAEVTGAYEGASTYVLWRMANGNDLIGTTSYGCGPVCDYSYSFQEYNGTTATDVSKTILPQSEISEHFNKIEKQMQEKYPDLTDDPYGQYMYSLPKEGTDLTLYMSYHLNDFEFPIMVLSWDKEKFSVKKKMSELP